MGMVERRYAYLVIEVTGTQEGKTKPGEYLLESEYKGNGEYTWCIYNFAAKGMPLEATITGVYKCIVELDGGQVTEESKAKLEELRDAA